jgi:hypothetical protein
MISKESKQLNKAKQWATMVDILDGQFPKGKCKERGQALVMLAYIRFMLEGMNFDEDGKPSEIQKKIKI